MTRPTLVTLAAVALAACASAPSDTARRSLVEAERAFAAMSVAQGIRAAFLASFADDGVGLEPGPVPLRETWSARPAPANPPTCC